MLLKHPLEPVLVRAKQLDSEALGALYQQFLPLVYGYVAGRVADRRLAEDITSEVFVSMLESISKLRATDEAGFSAWLLKIARFRIADHFRAQAGEPALAFGTVSNDEGEQTDVLLALPARDPAGDPELTAEVREEWRKVAEAINQLTEDQRQVIVAKLLLGYDSETVARIVGKNVAAVKALQHRGLQTLHRLLRMAERQEASPQVPGTPQRPRRKGGAR